jgi:hypothetical protein
MAKTSESLFGQLKGELPLRVAQAKRGIGSFITLDMQSVVPKRISHIWVYLCDWKLIRSGTEVLNSTDLGEEGAPLVWFDGRSLLDLHVDHQARTLEFCFDEDLRLHLAPNLTAYEPSDNLVMFFHMNNRVLAFSYANGFYETE